MDKPIAKDDIRPEARSQPPGRIKIMNALRSLLEEKEFSAITWAEIAQTAGVNEGLIYKYFKDRRNLLHQVLKEYLEGSENVLSEVASGSSLFAAHRDSPPGIPTLSTSDVRDLQETLRSIRDGAANGHGIYPRVYEVNERIDLLAEPPWLQDWD